MAKCKDCNMDVSNGNEYCDTCLNKGKVKSNESYLDSLLNSVINTQPETGENYNMKSKENNSTLNLMNDGGIDMENDNALNNEPDNENENINMSQESTNEFQDVDYPPDTTDESQSMDLKKEYFDEFGSLNIIQETDEFQDIDFIDKKINEFQDIDFIDKKPDESQDIDNMQENNNELDNFEISQEDILDFNDFDLYEDLDDNIIINDFDLFGAELDSDEEKNLSAQNNTDESDNNKLETFEDLNILPDEIEDILEEDPSSSTLQDLLKEVNEDDIDDDGFETEDSNFQFEQLDEQQDMEETDNTSYDEPDIYENNMTEEEQEAEDFMNLLNQVDENDSVANDIHAINDLLSDFGINHQDAFTSPNDVGEVFSDALTAVSTLNDPIIEEDFTDLIPKQKKAKKVKKKDLKQEVNLEAKKSFLQKLFANVEDEGIKKKPTSKSKITNIDDESAVSLDATLDGNNSEGKKNKKSKKNKKNAKDKSTTSDGNSNEDEKSGDNKNAVGQKVSKETRKLEKKEKKKLKKQVIEVIDEIEEEEGRINRVGASIVFLFFALIAVVLIIGTNLFSYSIKIKNATNYYERQKYTEAYNEVYGIEIEDEDIEIYDKIMTVMFVNKQLNSYNNNYAMEMYPQALDSLLKGLSRYEKYIELATMLGIESDLKYVKKQIVTELDNVFNISEKEAQALLVLNSENQAKYSLQVYDVVLENMKN